MLFNASANGDPRSFMYYHGEYYINGTEVALSDEYISTHLFDGKKLWKYAHFYKQIRYNNANAYLFCAIRHLNLPAHIRKEYATSFVVEAYNIDNAVEIIIKPIKLSNKESQAIDEYIAGIASGSYDIGKDWNNDSLKAGWIIYVILMVASLIFKQFYLLWIIITYIFFKWRKDVLES